MNSEVWDLRTLSLLRSCPALDGAAVTFAGADVLFATQRPLSDDLRETLSCTHVPVCRSQRNVCAFLQRTGVEACAFVMTAAAL